ncbi:4'-phosphopantetheinyl transferase family protein [Jiella sonneratiae]|uniref:4'-phosphopantetheinyl transferase superfamily protein n=1 Tax=Jiella sonneratiae TaxID=2816856 RepID=A0ABS3J0E4_9HYPH|nr:4'-phosphopantetheinyl transferase superfamily protein [Jiella sonneratiae]MBO0903150.1 4'-phosphopantetheinyl transferase superfamily protein [Jiella sonneratiae]
MSDPSRIDVHLADPAPATGEDAADWLAILAPAERERYDRFKVEGARQEYLAGRVLVRRTLSRHAPIEPKDWRFEANAYGRPAIAAEQAGLAPGLVFNLSHTRGLVALAVGYACDLGVDVEWPDRTSRPADLCGRYFAESEARHVRSAEGAELTERFFAFWTLKEAYIKARGMGLALPLDGFAYDLSGPAPAIRFSARCPDDPARWRFLRRRIGTSHRLALAVSSAEPVLGVRFWRAAPFAADMPERGEGEATLVAAPAREVR